MELAEVMRTAFSCREFTDDEVTDDDIEALLDLTRFAPSGPFVWNLLLAARDRGLAGALTTMTSAREPVVQKLLGFPTHVAVAAMVPLGRPMRRVTRLSREPVDALLRWERWTD